MTRVYIVFKRARTCIRVYTDLCPEAVNEALSEALAEKKSLFLTVFQPNGDGFKRSHVTVTPYEILKDCVFHTEATSDGKGDPCLHYAEEARGLEEILKENHVERLKP